MQTDTNNAEQSATDIHEFDLKSEPFGSAGYICHAAALGIFASACGATKFQAEANAKTKVRAMYRDQLSGEQL